MNDFDWSALMQEVDTVRQDIARGKRIFSMFDRVDDALFDRVNALKEQLGDAGEIVKALQQQKAQLETEVPALQREVDTMRAALASLRREHDASALQDKATRDRLAIEIGAFKKEHDNLTRTIQAQRQTRDELLARNGQLRSDVEALEQRRNTAEQQLAQMRQAAQDMMNMTGED